MIKAKEQLALWGIRRFAVLILVVAIAGYGCDLFSTRPTEPPLNVGSPWIAPSQWSQVFVNMSIAAAELNSQNYLRAFFAPEDGDLGYVFIPRPNFTGWPLSAPWGYAEESQTTQTLFSSLSPDSIITLLFDQVSDPTTYGNEDSVWVRQSYTFSAPTNNPTLPSKVSGQSDFLLARTTTGYWAIFRWEDLQGSPSWTDLKAGLY
jgi:hypothetical protein